MKTRFVRVVGFAALLQRYWGACEKDVAGCHRAEHLLGVWSTRDEARPHWDAALARREDFLPQLARCGHCGAEAPAEVAVTGSLGSRYDTPSGRPEPGDLYVADWYRCARDGGRCIHGWSNCDGRHLVCVLPNGHPWDIGGRANNCTLPEDTLHRCWVRHGDPERGEAVHVDKAGQTCAAGAGSIAVPGWHGFLQQGELVSC